MGLKEATDGWTSLGCSRRPCGGSPGCGESAGVATAPKSQGGDGILSLIGVSHTAPPKRWTARGSTGGHLGHSTGMTCSRYDVLTAGNGGGVHSRFDVLPCPHLPLVAMALGMCPSYGSANALDRPCSSSQFHVSPEDARRPAGPPLPPGRGLHSSLASCCPYPWASGSSVGSAGRRCP